MLATGTLSLAGVITIVPKVDVHGTWVRSLVHDGFGRLIYKVTGRLGPGCVEFLVLWEPNKDLGSKNQAAGYHETKDLMVRPYKPRPWIDDPCMEVVYDGDRRI